MNTQLLNYQLYAGILVIALSILLLIMIYFIKQSGQSLSLTNFMSSANSLMRSGILAIVGFTILFLASVALIILGIMNINDNYKLEGGIAIAVGIIPLLIIIIGYFKMPKFSDVAQQQIQTVTTSPTVQSTLDNLLANVNKLIPKVTQDISKYSKKLLSPDVKKYKKN